MFCGKCGTENDNRSKFCRKCGAPLVPAKKPQVHAPKKTVAFRTVEKADVEEWEEDDMSLYPEDGLSRSAKIIIAAAGAGILVLAVMLVLSLIKNKPNAGMNEEAVAAETAQVVEETQESTGESEETEEAGDSESGSIGEESGYSEEGDSGEAMAQSEAASSTDDSEYILLKSSSELISREDLEGFDAKMCKLARNEIYARHGRIFTDEMLRGYFESKEWYVGSIAPEAFTEDYLSEIEIANENTIIAYEREIGIR